MSRAVVDHQARLRQIHLIFQTVVRDLMIDLILEVDLPLELDFPIQNPHQTNETLLTHRLS